MKWSIVIISDRRIESPPTREAWIEIWDRIKQRLDLFWSPPTREAWIEIHADRVNMMQVRSPPTREAWIEMLSLSASSATLIVASHPGGVD